MTAEADKLAKKGVWNLEKVKEWNDVCNNLSKNEFALVGNVLQHICGEGIITGKG